MAQLVNTLISVEGRSLRQFSSLSLSQGIFEHHSFRLICPADSIDGAGGEVFSMSKNLVGAPITIQVGKLGLGSGSLEFRGLVTRVEAARSSGHNGDIILSGYSPTILLDNGPHCKSWEKKAIKNIAQDTLKHFPQNLLQPQVAPASGETLAYTVQYKETAWQFLSRLCAIYGEWFFYNGQKLMLAPPRGEQVTLVYGSNLSHFNMSLQVRPASFQALARDYINDQIYTSSPQGIAAKAGLQELGQFALQKSEEFYSTQPKIWHNHFLTNKKQLDDQVNTRAAMQSSSMVRFNGHSGHPGVQVGAQVSVSGRNVFSQADESFGDYTVIGVEHYCDGQGNYSNDFTAIPAGVKMPPVPRPTEPGIETQSAIVTDNHDGMGLGRVRVKFHWMNGAEKSPWMRIASPHGGGDKGMFFIPEVGEEVIVGFEGDSPTKPYIIGTVYHGAAKNSYSNGGNDVKALQTRSGNKVIMDDAAGSVFVEDKDGNSVLIDGAGNITVKANKTVLIDAVDEITFKTKKITMLAENEIYMQSKKLDAQLSETATVFGKNSVTAISDTLVTLESKNKVEAVATTEVDISGMSKVTVNSTNVEVNGSIATNIRGGMVNLNT